MAHFRLNPKHDLVFNCLFAEQESKANLIALLNAILCQLDGHAPIADLTVITERRLIRRRLREKSGVLDVLARLDTGEFVNIEMQVRDLGNMTKRTLYYLARLYTGSIQRGEDHSLLKRTIAINLVNFEISGLAPGQYHHTFHFREDRAPHDKLTDMLEVHYIEFPKFEQVVKDMNNPLHRWLMFMDEKLSEDDLKELMRMDQAIEMAEKDLQRLGEDDEFLRQLAEYEEKSERDWNAAIRFHSEKAMAEGRETGRKEGREEGKKEMVLKMLRKGIDYQLIAQLSDMSIQEIERMAEELEP